MTFHRARAYKEVDVIIAIISKCMKERRDKIECEVGIVKERPVQTFVGVYKDMYNVYDRHARAAVAGTAYPSHITRPNAYAILREMGVIPPATRGQIRYRL